MVCKDYCLALGYGGQDFVLHHQLELHRRGYAHVRHLAGEEQISWHAFQHTTAYRIRTVKVDHYRRVPYRTQRKRLSIPQVVPSRG